MRRDPARRLLPLIGGILLCLAGAADGLASAPAPTPEATEASAALPVPHPALSGLEERVAAQLGAGRSRLEEALAGAVLEREEMAVAYGELGRLYHAYGFAAAAAASYTNALRLAPGEFRWLYCRGILHQEEGRLAAAAADYQGSLAVRPDDPAALFRLAEVELARGRMEQSEALLGRLLAAGSADPASEAAAHALLGQLALARREHAEAAARLEKALALAPQANRLHYPLAMAYRGLGDLERARQHLARQGAVGIRPTDPLGQALEALRQGEIPHLQQGQLAFRAGRPAEAAVEFAAAVAARPDSVPARINLAAALAGTGDVAAAIAELRSALALDGDNATAHFNLGLLLTRSGEEEAINHLRRAALLLPDDAEVRLALGDALLAAGREEAALPHYRRASELAPADARGALGEARSLARLGRLVEARDRLLVAGRLDPANDSITRALLQIDQINQINQIDEALPNEAE